MSIVLNTATCDAGESRLMQIESRVARGFSGLQLIGNASEVCRDGKERARTALEAINIDLPMQRMVVSLTPADVKKDGSQFDLPLAISLATLAIDKPLAIRVEDWLFAAELGLDGSLRPTRGMIPIVLTALKHNLRGVVVPMASIRELDALGSLQLPGFSDLLVMPFDTLAEVLDWIYGNPSRKAWSLGAKSPAEHQSLHRYSPNFDDMVLSPKLRKIATIVATGRHSLLLRGSPGSGKSMFAARLNSVLPAMNRFEHLESLRLRSGYGGELTPALLAGLPPFRNPHHQASASAIMGTSDQPGELSLAHGGVLFLDELPEFRRDILEGLREPLENAVVSVSRAKQKVQWHADVLLLAACNNCPCGWLGSSRRSCRCSTQHIRAYHQRLSGPILDRIDLHVNMPDLSGEASDLFFPRQDQSAQIRGDIELARTFAESRNRTFGVINNRDIPARDLQRAFAMSESDFCAAVDRYQNEYITRRSLVRALRVARTCADLDQSLVVQEPHLELAFSFQAEAAARERGEHLMGLL